MNCQMNILKKIIVLDEKEEDFEFNQDIDFDKVKLEALDGYVIKKIKMSNEID